MKEKALQHQLELEHQKEVALQSAQIQESERKRIAETLHDDIGNRLNILSLWINNEETWNSPRSREIIVQQIPEVIEAVRTISHALYPSNLEKFGLILSIESMIANVNESLDVRLILSHNYKKRDISIEVPIYRIIQEYLNNVIKHANASNMWIQIRDTDCALSIILSDDGIGFDSEIAKSGMGLKNIETRVQTLNGVSKWKSIINEGTRLIIISKNHE